MGTHNEGEVVRGEGAMVCGERDLVWRGWAGEGQVGKGRRRQGVRRRCWAVGAGGVGNPGATWGKP